VKEARNRGRDESLSPLMHVFGGARKRRKRSGLDNDKPPRGVISHEERTILWSVGTCYHWAPSAIKRDDVPPPSRLSRRIITALIIKEREREREREREDGEGGGRGG